MTQALVVVDLQNDFMPYGSLPVRDGDVVVPVANKLMPLFDIVVATQDWHPADHGSFAVNHPGKEPGDVVELGGVEQVLWPAHCVQDTEGAMFHPDLNTDDIDHIIRKGTDANIDSYSTFFDNGHRKETGLEDLLRDEGVTEVVLMGLATDYCVLWSVHDAIGLGFKVTVVEDGCRAVELTVGDGAMALEDMRESGATITTSQELLGER